MFSFNNSQTQNITLKYINTTSYIHVSTYKQLMQETQRKVQNACAELKPHGIYPKRKSLVMP